MNKWKKHLKEIVDIFVNDEHFLHFLHGIETLVAKVLSLALVIVIFVSIFDLMKILYLELSTEPLGFFQRTILEIFGLFLNVLIALELLENITAYLRKHIFQAELVIVTALIAVARKIIIFDLKNQSNLDLIALAVSILALSAGYWLIKRTNRGDT